MKALPSDHQNLFETQENPNWTKKIRNLVKRLIRNEDGLGAVEFALLVPVLLALYVGAVELSTAMTIDKKVSKASAVATDIISQLETVDQTTLQEMVGIAQAIVAPYDSSSLGMQVVGIEVDSAGTPTIAWSWNETNGTPFTAGDDIIIPTAFAIPDTFLLQTTVNLGHNLLLLSPNQANAEWSESTISLSKLYYLHQREAKTITCSDC